MKILFAVIITFTIASTAVGQPYLIKQSGWQQKIKKNYFLAPLFYGIKRTPAQKENENEIAGNLTKKYGSVNSAYVQSLITGWNYFYIGKIDSAIMNFNQAYLIDKNNLETYLAVGSILTFINGKPSDELINKIESMNKVSSGWDLMAFFGDSIFLEQLKIIQQKNPVNNSLTKFLKNPAGPYLVDSGKYIVIKVIYDNHEGVYKMGRPAGLWADYYDDNHKRVMRYYTIVNGKESGKITAYHKNGKLMAVFNKSSNGDIDGEYKVFDYNGELVRIEYWHKNSADKKDFKIFKEWEEDGTITYETVDNQTKEFIWNDGKKALKE